MQKPLGHYSWLLLGWSEDVFATRRRGVYVEAGGRLPLRDTLRLEATVAYYDLDAAYGRGYTRAQLSLVQTLRSVDLRDGCLVMTCETPPTGKARRR